MKALHVITGLPKAAGTSVFCVEACDGLSRLGIETVIAVQQRGAEDYQSQENVPVLDASKGFDALEFKPDIVHVHALWSPFLHRASLWARRSSLPVIHSPHGMLTPWALRAKWHKKLLALAAYQYGDLRRARLLHATAHSEAEDIRRIGLSQPVCVIPLGVHLPLQCERPVRKVRTVLFVSRVHPKKGLLNLVAAWARARPAGWRMVIAGPDQDGHTAEVRALAERLGVVKDFHFIGSVYGADKDELYACSDLFVLPTFSENFGVVVLEALAHGCPVITTKGAPWSELLGEGEKVNGKRSTVSSKPLSVESDPLSKARHEGCQQFTVDRSRFTDFTDNGRCGWWIDIGVEPLAEALREAMRLSDEERCAMGENGRKLVEAKYTWPAIAEQMKAAYEWILNGGERPDCVRVS